MFDLTLDGAWRLDLEDGLARFRGEFHIPIRADGREEIYLCGNSLGLQPKRTEAYVGEFLNAWRNLGVRGHFEGSNPWLPYHESVADSLAALVGGRPDEVVAMSSLTVNLHLMLVSFYRPTKTRYKILIEEHAFPSDAYAVASQVRYHGFDPRDALVTVAPRGGEDLLRDEEVFAAIAREKDALALILLPGVQYYTGQVLSMAEIARLGHAAGAVVGFDLAHAVGNVTLDLHVWDVDFAVWCSYKYLNAGAGAVGGLFVHRRHVRDQGLPRFAGWWGHDKATRFQMGSEFVPIPAAEGWQLSNPPILSLAAVRASLDVFAEAGYMPPLRAKSERLTAYLAELLREECGDHISILTPAEPARRGCQLSLSVRSDRLPGRELYRQLEAAGVACDWREPNVIRVAPAPLYNTFEDLYRFVHVLKGLL